jgi:DNA (cytosine-5)-methyltransferase 1
MTAYYNEKDPFAAEWLRKLIAANMIAPGDVDERSIEDVVPVELAKYTQCHFFAGIGVWSCAMRRAGWPDDRHGWSGSCPCQPFSQAGQGAGFADERHLWPAFFHLIEQCRPDIVFGEQVASPDGLAWLDLVQSDMEGTDYAFGALDQCAAGFGAPHIRQRLYWMAYDKCGTAKSWRYDLGATARGPESETHKRQWLWNDVRPSEHFSGLADDAQRRREEQWKTRNETSAERRPFFESSSNSAPDISRYASGPINGHWQIADWLRCKDDKWRPVEPSAFPLAHGVANRVGLLRGYGNAIVAPQAEEFIKAAMQYAP